MGALIGAMIIGAIFGAVLFLCFAIAYGWL